MFREFFFFLIFYIFFNSSLQTLHFTSSYLQKWLNMAQVYTGLQKNLGLQVYKFKFTLYKGLHFTNILKKC